jgi:hypothetical protein
MKAVTIQIKQFLMSREGYTLLGIILGAILIRFPLMSFRGYYADLSLYVNWGNSVNQDITNIYTTSSPLANGGFQGFGGNQGFQGGMMSGINYPPGMPYVFGAVVYFYNHVLANIYHTSLSSIIRTDGIGPFIAKLPILLADIALIIFFYLKVRARHSEKFSLIATAALAFSPALLYNGVIWGQTDGLVSLPVIIAIFAIISEQYVVGGISIALAVLLKPQPIIFIPLILIYLYRWSDRQKFLRFCIAGLLTGLIVLFPILVPHFQLLDMFKNMQTESYNDNYQLTSYAFNFWWLIGYQSKTIGTYLLGIKCGTIGDILFIATTLLCCIQIWRHKESIYLFMGMAIQMFAFFMFMGGQHERYLFMFIPLTLASMVVIQRKDSHHLAWLYVLGTGLCLLNMMMAVSSSGFANGQVIPYLQLQGLSSYFSSNIDSLGNSVAFLHLVVFIYALYVYLAHKFEPLEQKIDVPNLALYHHRGEKPCVHSE